MKATDKTMKHLPWIALLIPIPYIYSMITRVTCGYDCPQYLYQLRWPSYIELLQAYEPLWHIIFTPLASIFTEQAVINMSILLMVGLSSFGIYLLSRRIGLGKRASWFAVAAAGMNAGVVFYFGMNTLRNQLAFSIFPFFVYFYLGKGRRDRILYPIMLYLMALAHRTTVFMAPLMGLYRLIKRDWKGLAIDVLVFIPILALYTLINPDSVYGGSSNIFTWQLDFIGMIGWNSLVANFNFLMMTGGMTLALALAALFFVDWRNRVHLWIVGCFAFFAGVVILINPLVAGRAAFYMGMPMGLLAGILYSIVRKGKNFLLKAVIILVSLGMVLALVPYSTNSPQFLTEEEAELIQSIDIPEGSALVVPERLKFYTMYVWGEKYDVLNVPWELYTDDAVIEDYPWAQPYWRAYRGINDLGRDIYYIETGHGPVSDESVPELVHLPSGGSSTVSLVIQ